MFGTQGNEEARIIGRVLSGEREAFGFLVKRHLPAVYAVAYARTRNHADAEDVAQEAFLSALQSLDRLREPRKFVAWTVSIARRLAVDTFNAKARRSAAATSPVDEEDPRPAVERQELFALVDRHLAELDEASREVILLHYFSGRNGREIAQLLGVSHGAVRKRLQRAREALGERILREVGTAQDVKAMLAQPAERISCAVLAAPVAWKVGAVGAAVGATGSGMAVLAKAVVGLAVVLAAGMAAWTHMERPGASPSSSATVVAQSVPSSSAEGGASKATPVASSDPKSTAPAAGQAVATEPQPQVLVTARKTSGGFAKPGSIQLCLVEPGSAAASVVDPQKLQRIVQTSGRTPIYPKGNHTGTNQAVFSGLAPGRYIAYWSEGSEELVSASGPIPFDLSVGGAPIELTLDVTEGGVITGRVTDVATGRPLEGVTINATHASNSALSPRESGHTDANGNYRIAGICKGTYALNPLDAFGFFAVRGKDKLLTDAAPGKTSEGLDFVVRSTPAIRGRVLDLNGQPAAGVPVRAKAPFRRDKSSESYGMTDANGTFELKGMEPTDGVYVGYDPRAQGNELCAVPVGPLTLTDAGIDSVVIRAQEPAEVSGVVVDSEGKPVAEAAVELTSTEYGGCGFSTKSNGTGAFSFKNAHASAYYLIAYAASKEDRRERSLRSQDRVEFEVRPGDEKAGLKLTVPSTGKSLSGTVRDSAGKPIEGIQIMARDVQNLAFGSRPPMYTTDRNGSFVIPGLTSGTFELSVSDPVGRYLPASHEHVPSGSAGVDFVLQEAHFVEGRVVGLDDAQPVAAFHVFVTSPREEDNTAEPNIVAQRYVEDGAGRFRIPLYFKGVRNLTVAARAPGFGGEEVVLPGVAAEKGVSNVVLKLPRPATVKGRVFDPDGAPKLGVKILAGDIAIVSYEHRSYEPLTISAVDGTFELKNLSRGPQVLTAYSSDSPPERIEVDTTPGETQTVDVHLKRGAVLEGDVSLGGASLGRDDRYLLRVDYEPDAERQDGSFDGPRGTSHYSFEHPLRPGQIWIRATIEQGPNTAGLIERTLVLKEGEPAKVNLDVPGGPCVIEGTVAVPEGVNLFSLELEMPMEGGKVTIMRSGKPGASLFEDLPEGEGVALIRAWRPPEGPELVRTVPVHLVPGTPCRLDVDLR